MSRLTTLLSGIARKHLGFQTLETQSSDSLNFQDVAVLSLEAALLEAYWRGFWDADPNGGDR